MGNAFTLVRLIVAFISGLICGLLVDLLCRPTSKSQGIALSPQVTLTPLQPEHPIGLGTNTPLSPARPTPRPANKRSLGQAIRYGLITLPADLAKALSIGLLLAGLITTVLPENWMSGSWSSGPLAFLLATIISLPLYVRDRLDPHGLRTDCCRALPRGCPDLPYHGPRNQYRDGRGRVANAWTFGNTDVSP